MRLLLIFSVLTIMLQTNQAVALSVASAQNCANELLSAYNERRFPKQFLDIPSLTSRAFGSTFRELTAAEQKLAIKTAAKLLRESFEEPTGLYMYRDLVVDRVETTKQGNFRIIGNVHITSPIYTGPGSFLALTSGSCQIFQVRIEDVATLDGRLREMLNADPATKALMQKRDN